MPRVTIRMTVVAKRATIEFAEGLGIGVLSTQDVTFELPDSFSHGILVAQAAEYGEDLLKDAVEVQYEVIEHQE